MDHNDRPEQNKQQAPSLKNLMGLAAIILAVVLPLVLLSQRQQTLEETTLSEIARAIEAGTVESLAVQGDLLTATKIDGSTLSARKESNISAMEALQLLGASTESLKTLPIVVRNPSAGPGNILSILLTFAPIFIIGFLMFRVMRQMQGGGFTNMGSLGRSNPRVVSGAAEKEQKAELPAVTFDDVAGADQAKLELQEVVEFLKEAHKFIKLGARIPKGVLMVGPPGTGKTLMAKAVAGEAGVPFFSISGSEFVEMFVGVGASRVRDLFKRARDQSPSVIFIDEIDAVGRRRGVGLGGGNDEREQTLNQILVEMDGFGTSTNVIVIAATNRPDVLDSALLRPGRFDRKVILDRPDVHAREEILEVHTRGKPLAADVSLSDLARLTPGFAGADLENLVNEAAILAARRNLNRIGRAEFQDAMERIVAGPERKGKIISDQERQVVAYHEAGHAVVMHNLEHSDPVHKVSIVSRGMALGYTMPLPENDRYLRTREAFEDEIVGLLGGRAAEELVFQRVTTGAANDLERATDLARAMVTRYGFSEKLGLRTFGEEQGNPYLGNMGEIRNYSEEMAQAIDQEIRRITEMAYQRARNILSAQRHKLEALASKLLEVETVERAEFEALMA
ncbi:MAG: ATP-dependent zinc metalloprotease FtsH [Anaerolineae bacterium]